MAKTRECYEKHEGNCYHSDLWTAQEREAALLSYHAGIGSPADSIPQAYRTVAALIEALEAEHKLRIATTDHESHDCPNDGCRVRSLLDSLR